MNSFQQPNRNNILRPRVVALVGFRGMIKDLFTAKNFLPVFLHEETLVGANF
jgi:hypothetical protein